MRPAIGDAAPGRGFGLLGVPTSAGTHHAGQDGAPRALRAAGLLEGLAERGVVVADFGDLPVQVHRPTERVAGVRDLNRVARIASTTAARVSEIRRRGLLPLVVGGDCTITLGVVAGLAEHVEVGLAYLDGDADLSVPEQSESGVLDTMGLTHLLGGGAVAVTDRAAVPLAHLGAGCLVGIRPGRAIPRSVDPSGRRAPTRHPGRGGHS